LTNKCFKSYLKAILLKSLKTDSKEIYNWLVECNMDKLSLTTLEQLEKYLPEDKMLTQYQELKENIEELDTSEQFLVTVSFLKLNFILFCSN
jgi:hypothetical protein